MTCDHADFHVGTGPNARWPGSVGEVGGPVSNWPNSARRATPRRPPCSPPPTETATRWPSPRWLIRQRVAEVGFVAVPGPNGKAGKPWLATTSSGW